MADADFVDVPVDELLSQKFSAERFTGLFGGGSDRPLETPVAYGSVSSSNATGGWHKATEDHGTSHMSIVDANGMMVSMTTTVNAMFGSRVAVPNTGVLLNNQLCDFDAVGIVEGVYTANRADGSRRLRRTASSPDSGSKGGKRPRSSMTPLIVQPGAAQWRWWWWFPF